METIQILRGLDIVEPEKLMKDDIDVNCIMYHQ